MTPPAGPRPPRLLQLADGAMVWAGRKADDVDHAAAARAAALTEAEHEYRRLLYVAMTRAADRLIICGADGINRRPKDCWYDLVCEPLRPLLTEEEDGGEKVFRYRKLPSGAIVQRPPASAETAKSAAPEAPSWLREPAPPEEPKTVLLSPSSAFEHDIAAALARGGASPADRRKALARGRIVHRLLQSLPDIPVAARKDAIARYVALAAADFSTAEQADMAGQVLTILNDLVFADIFAPGSRAEVPIVGQIAGPGARPFAVSGQVDRLAVTRDEVLIADYKTDRTVPPDAADAPPPYVAQLALYRAVLARIYPTRTIRAALLFTEGPTLLQISGPAMDAALAKTLAKHAVQRPKITLR